MNKNPALALMQIETALNHLQNTMVDEKGNLTWDEEFFRLYDELLEKLQRTRQIAEDIKKRNEK